ncbi:MAG: type II toxin-antitoxin system RelE/ParE family toxin [Rhizobium sp.]|nr:type II toxin-antitoxin system RelE/ParE family toxin [Rhizobium sp.]
MKRRRYTLTADAQRDLAEIYLYLADAGDPSAGRRLVGSLVDKIRKLARLGTSGVARDWIAPGLRAFPHKSRSIYFRIVGDQIRDSTNLTCPTGPPD